MGRIPHKTKGDICPWCYVNVICRNSLVFHRAIWGKFMVIALCFKD